MKIADGLKLIENGWIRKPKGFRVRFHRQTDAGVEAGLSNAPRSFPAELGCDCLALCLTIPPVFNPFRGVCAISIIDL